jgi:hypothetical protein
MISAGAAESQQGEKGLKVRAELRAIHPHKTHAIFESSRWKRNGSESAVFLIAAQTTMQTHIESDRCIM